MDLFGYKSGWGDKEGATPTVRLDVFGMRWNLWEGMHPSLASSSALFNRDELKSGSNLYIPSFLKIPPVGNVLGHNTIKGWFKDAPGNNDEVPISPLFARDLAGRTVYLGTGPEQRKSDEWSSDSRIQNAHLPKGVRLVTDQQINKLLENVFLTGFRTLEMSLNRIFSPVDMPDVGLPYVYSSANLYPYKLRLDTFYIDGWKLPQLEMLFVNKTTPDKAEQVAADLMKRWSSRPEGQGYDDFISSCGDEFFEQIFTDGCTLIPTIEAFNGYNKVGANFELEGFWQGRAVQGLHTIKERRESDAPEGTILEVIRPGYMLSYHVQPAEVVVSDGTKYVSPHNGNPKPKTPDLRLPHQRLSAKWGAAWIPTHPIHFEAPAIWGWCAKSSHFVQSRGPLWDPLHYYYESVDKVINSYENDKLKNNQLLVRVPDGMKERFYPVISMRGYDIMDRAELKRRYENKVLPLTTLRRFDDGEDSCDVGYHPLPLLFEFELDNWWLPELDPRKRLSEKVVPFKEEENICPIIESSVRPASYIAATPHDIDAPWFRDTSLMVTTTTEAIYDYPQLNRYFEDLSPPELIKAIFPLNLEYLEDLFFDKEETHPNSYEDMESLNSGLAQAVIGMSEQAIRLLRLRHNLYRNSKEEYIKAYWYGTPPSELYDILAATSTEDEKSQVPYAAFTDAPVV